MHGGAWEKVGNMVRDGRLKQAMQDSVLLRMICFYFE